MSETSIDKRTPLHDSPIIDRGLNRDGSAFRPLQSSSREPSPWSRSRAKRCFDVLAVLLGLPFILPVLLAISIAVRLTSRGPALFMQTRIGKHGATFRICKFRTMVHTAGTHRPSVTTIGNQEFTSIGRFLRKWKLDELPQLFNVLRGDMSLVGPRPKMPEHQTGLLFCRPGITGAATLAFAREEVLLAGVPNRELSDFMRHVVNPLKSQMDVEYMSVASLASDLKLIVKSLLRDWPEGCPQCWPRSGQEAGHALPTAGLGDALCAIHRIRAVTETNTETF